MSELFQLLIPALLGLLFVEGMYVSRGIKRDSSPNSFSWGYYLKQPRNQIMLFTNVVGVLGLVFGHAEVVSIVVKLLDTIPVLQGKVDPGGYPVLTGLATGLFGPLVLRFGTRWMGEKLPTNDADR